MNRVGTQYVIGWQGKPGKLPSVVTSTYMFLAFMAAAFLVELLFARLTAAPLAPRVAPACIAGFCLFLGWTFRARRSFRVITVTDTSIESRQPLSRLRTVIGRDEVEDILEGEFDFLGVRGLKINKRNGFYENIFVPSTIPGYEQVKAQLMSWVPS